MLTALGVALGLGLLIGVERERHMAEEDRRGSAGVRTFALASLLGALAAEVGGTALVAVGAASVGALAFAGYARTPGAGLTTEIALLVTFLLGALSREDAAAAAATATVVTIVLAARDPLHRWIAESLSRQEISDGLVLAAAALIVLPLLPDEGVGPGDALNAQTVWRLVVLVMLVQAAGHVALRLFGARRGLPLSGLLGGLVSATATIATMGGRARADPPLRGPAVAGASAANITTVVLLAGVVGVTSPDALRGVAVPLAAALAATLGATAVAWRATGRRAPGERGTEDARDGRAFDLRVAFGLAALISGVLLASALLADRFGTAGALVAAAVAALADVQSAAIGAAALVDTGRLDPDQAALAVLVALTVNSGSKAVVAAVLGGRAFAWRVWLALAAMVGAAWAAWALAQAAS